MAWNLGAGIEGRTVMVTGAGGGIGGEVVGGLVEAGANVIAVDLDEGSMAAALGARGITGVRLIEADVSATTDHPRLIERSQEDGPIYGLVHCAAVLRRRKDIREVTEEDWDIQASVNLKGTFFLCRAVAESMRDSGTQGRIVTFSSQGWWTGGFGGSVAYAATKGGIVSMTRGLARTYGPLGITVNSVAPGQARTEMLLTDLDESVLEAMTAQTPLGRVAEPEEVASVALFLISRHASFITGSTLNVSGGFLMY